MSKDLKPCPFCGGEDTEIAPGLKGDWYIGCLTCNYQIRCEDCTEEDTVRYWNTRPAEDALKAENERLTEVLELFRKTLADVAKMAINSDQEQIFEKCRDVLRDIYLEEKFRESFDKILHNPDTEKGGEDE
jgi:Lar family restriction alleviation protein